MTEALPSRRRTGRYEYEVAPGHWVSRQRVWQLRRRGKTLPQASTFIVLLREGSGAEWVVLLKAHQPAPAMTRAKRMVRKRLKRQADFIDMMAFSVERSLPAILPWTTEL